MKCDHLILWSVYCRTFKPLSTIPRLTFVGSERRCSDSYLCEGRLREQDDFCLFKYTLSGEGRFRDANGEYPLSPGSAFLCRVSDPATAYYYPKGATDDWEFMYVCFDGQASLDIVEEMTRRYGPIYTLPRAHKIIEKFLAMHRFRNLNPKFTISESAGFIYELLTALIASHEEQLLPDPGNLLVKKAQEEVSALLQTNLTATQLADRLFVSREHLTRVFHEHLGVTPYRYILHEQMLLACHLLKETALSIKEISTRTGCESQAVFTRRFQSILHMTPSQFRKMGTISANFDLRK